MSGADYDARAEKLSEQAFRLYTLDEFLIPPASSLHLIQNLVPAESIVVVFGMAKSGKTFSVCDLLMHAAHGMHWHRHEIERPLRVVFLAGEGRGGLKVRLQAWREQHATELRGNVHILPECFALTTNHADLQTSLAPVQPDIVVVDTLNAYFGSGDENSTRDMTAFIAAIRELRDSLRCAVLVIHHTGHNENHRERGSSALRAAADVIVHIARDAAGSGLIAFKVIDARDMEPWPAALALRLVPVTVEWQDAGGKALSTCVVERSMEGVTLPGRINRPLGPAQETVLAVLRDLSTGREPIESGEIILARADVSAVARSRDLSKQSVMSAIRSLAKLGRIRLVEPGSVAIRPLE